MPSTGRVYTGSSWGRILVPAPLWDRLLQRIPRARGHDDGSPTGRAREPVQVGPSAAAKSGASTEKDDASSAQLLKDSLGNPPTFWRLWFYKHTNSILTAGCVLAMVLLLACALGTAALIALTQPNADPARFVTTFAMTAVGIFTVAGAVIATSLQFLRHWQKAHNVDSAQEPDL